MLVTSIFPFPKIVSILTETNFTFNPLPNDKILDWSKLKAIADHKINVTEKLKFVLGRLENIFSKGFLKVVTVW